MIKTILVPRDAAEITRRVLATGLTLARQFDAHIELLLLRRDPDDAVPFVFGSLSSNKFRKTITDVIEHQEDDRAAEIRHRFDEFCQENAIPLVDGPTQPRQGVTASWREGEDETLLERSRLNDLILLQRPGEERRASMLETVLLRAKRPILMAPPEAQDTVGQHITIGWNGSAEASQAVSSAMPLLVRAETVTILGSKRSQQSCETLQEYLAWHDINANLLLFERSGHNVGATLLQQAHSVQADLMVIGAYNRMRASQLLFGGVTQHLMRYADISVLMAH